MIKEAKILTKKPLHEGFTQLYLYELQVPSLKPETSYHTLHHREVMHCTDSVIVLIYSPKMDSIVFCQEFRTGVFLNANHDNPFILECVAGAIDKENTPEQTARKEVQEEAGLEVGPLQLIAKVYSSPGRITEKTYVFFTEIEEIPQVGIHGLAHEGEEILTHIIDRKKVFEMMDTMQFVDSMTLLALNWFRLRYS